MQVVTEQQLENASVDAQTLEDVINGDEFFKDGAGNLVSRLGTPLKTLKRILLNLAETPLAGSVVAILNARYDALAATMLSSQNTLTGRVQALELNQNVAELFVDANGNDANDGMSLANAKQSIQAIIDIAENQEKIGLTGVQIFDFVTPSTSTDVGPRIDNVDFFKRTSGDKITIDTRQDLSGHTWSNISGNVWSADVVFRHDVFGLSGPYTTGGTELGDYNTAMHGVWLDFEFFDWKVGSATIAANVAEVQNNPKSFTVHVKGSTQPDPRDGNKPAGTEYTYYVHLPDGSNPNGKNMRIADQQPIAFDKQTQMSGIRFIGNNGKDANAMFSAESMKSFIDCEVIDFGGHASVGPSEWHGCTIKGRARTGMSKYEYNQAFSGINLFYGAMFPRDICLSNLNIENCQWAIFGHGGGTPNEGFPRVRIEGIVNLINCGRFIEFNTTANNQPNNSFVREVICDAYLNMTEMHIGICRSQGIRRFDGGGSLTMAETTYSPRPNIAQVFDGSDTRFRNFTFRGPGNPGAERQWLFDAFRTSDLALLPVLEFDNCDDLGWNTESRFIAPPGLSVFNKAQCHVKLTNQTRFGNLTGTGQSQTAPVLPTQFTATAGCQFGFGSLTGPEIDALFATQGKTANISGQTHIVANDGTTISSPGWK